MYKKLIASVYTICEQIISQIHFECFCFYSYCMLFSNSLYSTRRKGQSDLWAASLLTKENTSFKAFITPSYLCLSEEFDHELYILAQHEIFSPCSLIPVQTPKQRNELPECMEEWIYRYESASTSNGLPPAVVPRSIQRQLSEGFRWSDLLDARHSVNYRRKQAASGWTEQTRI